MDLLSRPIGRTLAARMGLGAGLALLLLAACDGAGLVAPAATGGAVREAEVPAAEPAEVPAAEPAADPASPSALRDPARGLRFGLLDGLTVEEEHFSRAFPASKIRDLYQVAGPSGPLVTIDVWDNPAGLPLDRWFEEHLAFMRLGNAKVAEATVSPRAHRALLVDQPAGHAPARRAAVFAIGARLYRVTCLDVGDEAAAAAFTRVLDTFEEGAS